MWDTDRGDYMKRDRILINKEQIPYRFSILLGSELFILTLSYNKKHDFFTVALEDSQENVLCVAEPIIYGVPLWQDVQQAHKYPVVRIIPIDESNQENTVTWDNFGETVFLTIDNAEEELI